MKNFYKIFLIAAVVMFCFSPLSAQGQFIFDENPLIGKQAPDFTLNLTSGESTSLNKYRGSDTAIIFFWATWCPSCREELRILTRESERFAKSGIKIILVNVEENPRLVKSFIDKIKLPYPVFLDETSEVAGQYSIIGLPSLFFVDKNGVVAGMEHGLPQDYLEMLKAPADKKK